MISVEQVTDVLRQVLDPELGINIVDLGLIYEVQVRRDRVVYVRMTLTTPGCPLHDTIIGGVKRAIQEQCQITVEVDLVWEPAWTPERMSHHAKEMLGFS